jgi:uncharacterized phage protein gp47/JayE
MPTRFETISYTDLFNEAAKKLAARTGISNFSPDSKAFSIISTFIEEDRRLINNVNSLIDSLQLATATGSDLNLIGELVGQSRLPATKSFTRGTDQNLEFFVDTGTFGDINSGSSFTIPAGTTVFLESKDSESGARIDYRTTSSITCSISGSSIFFAAEAVETGTASNVAVNALNQHDFTSYTQSSLNKLKVRNSFSIANGRDAQSDSSYRFFINKAFTTSQAANETALRLTALTIPGVRDVKIIRGLNGIGTVGLIVDGFEGRSSSSILEGVRTRVNQISSAGDIVNVLAPKYVLIETELVLQTKVSLTAEQKTKLTNNIILSIKNYLNSFRIGESFSISGFVNFVLKSNNLIARVGRVNGDNTAEKVNAYFTDSFGIISPRRIIANDIAVNSDQRILVLDTISNPIRITIET